MPLAVLDLARDAVLLALLLGAPSLLAALIVGLVISLLQALTQVQEMTLSFVPKIVAVMVSLVIAAPFMLARLETFMMELATRIAASGG